MATLPPALVLRRFVIQEIKWETAAIFTLALKPESPADGLTFQAGQWIYLHLLNDDGGSWGKAAFSIASAPADSRETIELGIKVAGELTRRASHLYPDAVVGVQGPFGVFTRKPADEAPYVFFAAGIGITPLRSIIRDIQINQPEAPVILFYSNKLIEDTAYFELFDDWEKSWPQFHQVATLTAERPRIWAGEQGRIDAAMIRRHLPDISQGTFFICGPVPFMDAIQSLLTQAGVDTKQRLRKELFN